jgi:nucleoside-diphosphate-sugar epimerase
MVVFEPEAIRSFIHVQDMSSVFIQAIQNKKYGIFNMGCRKNQITKVEIANLISKYTGATVFTGNFNSDPEKRLNAVCFDKAEDNFHISISIEQGIQELVKYNSLLKEYVYI